MAKKKIKRIKRNKYPQKATSDGCRTLEEIESLTGSNIKRKYDYLTEIDRITYIYEQSKGRKILEVINVSYEILLEDDWVTIARYDSEHGYLHRHMRLLLTEKNELCNTYGVVKHGNPHKWLTWSIADLRSRCWDHKRGFLKRNKIVDKGW